MSESHSGFSYEGKRALVVGCFSGMGESTAKIVQGLGGEVHGIDYKSPDYTWPASRVATCETRPRSIRCSAHFKVRSTPSSIAQACRPPTRQWT